jgi:nucleotide-binding universal stress UspA family protein
MLNLSKKIVVAIDGSPQSDKAAEEAVRLAAGSRGKLPSKVYAVLVLPSIRTSSFTNFSPNISLNERDDWEEQRKRIFSVVENAAKEADVLLESHVIYGEPKEEILSFADQNQIDVIVIGSSGKGRVRRALLGSVSSKVAQHARCSVYIVR